MSEPADFQDLLSDSFRGLAIEALELGAQTAADALRQGDVSVIYHAGDGQDLHPMLLALLRQKLVDTAYDAKDVRDRERVERVLAGLGTLAELAAQAAFAALIAAAAR